VSPAERWGVETAWPNVLRCGAGAVRGGAVSGIGGLTALAGLAELAGLFAARARGDEPAEHPQS
jgi:hypothetical protein